MFSSVAVDISVIEIGGMSRSDWCSRGMMGSDFGNAFI
jgi:hypothetical protein